MKTLLPTRNVRCKQVLLLAGLLVLGSSVGVAALLAGSAPSLAAAKSYATGHTPLSVAIGDLNGDGKPDLATANLAAGTVSVLVNGGDGSFQAKLDFPTGRDPYSVAIGDLNDDRRPDLAVANSFEDTVSVLLGTPGLCTVQNVKRKTLPTAKRTIARANCRVGKIRRTSSKTVKRGRVISQKPKFGTVLPGGGKVNVVVSRGRTR
ncbi:MAG TPA: FG-GAP-like repeat-containing protein [Gaiellaceae bacterium]|nr:FG-GAP-like repeat-containing protein [Gaiellaceae bacterium]